MFCVGQLSWENPCQELRPLTQYISSPGPGPHDAGPLSAVALAHGPQAAAAIAPVPAPTRRGRAAFLHPE